MIHARALCAALLAAPVVLAGGKVVDVTPDPALLFFPGTSDPVALHGPNGILGTAGRSGLHRSLDGGHRWSRAMRGAVDPATGVEPFILGMCASAPGSSVVYALALGVLGGPDGVYRSDHFGATWHPGSIGPDYFAIDCAVSAFDPKVVYVQAFWAASGSVTVIKSKDGGETWAPTNVPDLQQGAFVRTSPVDPDTVYVGDHGPPPVIYVSHDGGRTFAAMPAGGTIRAFYFFPHPSDPAVFLAAADEGLYRSDDEGDTFTLVLPGGYFYAFDPADPQIGYAVADRLYRTSDGGRTFSPTAGPPPEQIGFGITGVAVAPQPSPGHGPSRRIYIGTSRGPHRSDDGGNTFIPIHDGYQGAAVNDLAIDALGRLAVGVVHTVAVFRAPLPAVARAYRAVGVNLPGPDSAAIAPSPTRPRSMVVALHFGGVWHTEDDGMTWNPSDVTNGGLFGQFTRMSFATDGAHAYIVTPRAGSGLYRSEDAGRTFTQTTELSLLGLAIDPRQPGTIYVGTYQDGSGLFKSTDGGATLTSLGQPGEFGTIAIDPWHPDVVYAGRASGGILRSDDGGANWTEASTGLPFAEPIGIAVDARIGRVFAWLQGAGLYQSDDRGAHWTATNDGESKRRSSIHGGRGKMVLDALVPGRVYLGNSGVVQVDTLVPHGW